MMMEEEEMIDRIQGTLTLGGCPIYLKYGNFGSKWSFLKKKSFGYEIHIMNGYPIGGGEILPP